MVKGKVINKLDNDRSLYYWLRNSFFLLQLRTKCCVNSESVNKFVEKYTCLLKYVHDRLKVSSKIRREASDVI